MERVVQSVLLCVVMLHYLHLSLVNTNLFLVERLLKNQVGIAKLILIVASQFYDLSLPNLQEVMDDDIMSPHVLSTPSTISSVGLSFQRSSPYESSSLYKNHPIPSFSSDYYPELLSSRSCGYSGFSPFPSSCKRSFCD